MNKDLRRFLGNALDSDEWRTFENMYPVVRGNYTGRLATLGQKIGQMVSLGIYDPNDIPLARVYGCLSDLQKAGVVARRERPLEKHELPRQLERTVVEYRLTPEGARQRASWGVDRLLDLGVLPPPDKLYLTHPTC